MRIKEPGLHVLLTALLCLLLSASAFAASTSQPSKSSTSQQEQQAAVGASLTELEGLIAALAEQLARLEALSGEAQELGEALAEAEAAAAAEEQPPLEAAPDALPGPQAGREAAENASDGIPLSEALSGLDELISSLREALTDLMAQREAARTTVDGWLAVEAGQPPSRPRGGAKPR